MYACVCVYYTYTYAYMYNPKAKGTGTKLYSRPRTLASTGAKVPVAPMQSAPMAFRIYNGFNHQMFSHFLDNLVNFTSCRACIKFMTFFKPDVIVKFIFTFAYLLLPCL